MNILRQPVIDPSAWTAAQMAARDDWVLNLDDAACGEIDAAVDHALRNGLDPLIDGRSAFPLPRFADRLNTGPRGEVAVTDRSV